MAQQKEYYAILGLKREDSPTAEQIKKAGTKAEMQLHPDRVRTKTLKENAAATEPEIAKAVETANNALQDAREAVLVLNDPKLRGIYDAQGYDAVTKARTGNTATVMSPTPEMRTPAPAVRLVQDCEEADNFFGQFLKNKPAGEGTTAAPSRAAGSTGSSGTAVPRNDAAARRAVTGRPGASRPSVATPAPQSNETPVTPVTPPPVQQQRPTVTTAAPVSNPLKDINDKADALKDAFGKVSVPLDSLNQIRDKLEDALKVVNAEIAKFKPPTP